MTVAFFGLSPKYKLELHGQLFEMVYHGKGLTWSELYNMPVWLRLFYYKKMSEESAKQKEQISKESKKKTKIDRPGI